MKNENKTRFVTFQSVGTMRGLSFQTFQWNDSWNDGHLNHQNIQVSLGGTLERISGTTPPKPDRKRERSKLSLPRRWNAGTRNAFGHPLSAPLAAGLPPTTGALDF